MNAGSKALRILEVGLLFLGLLLVVVFAFAHIHRFIMFRAEMATFETTQLESAKASAVGMEAIDSANPNPDLHQSPNTKYSLWSIQRTKSYQANLGKAVEPLAVLRIPALHLEVPVLEGTDEVTLNRGVGRIAGTSLPGQRGNIGIAGHRDGFVRKLKDTQTGDAVELVTISGTDVFVVDQIRITSPADLGENFRFQVDGRELTVHEMTPGTKLSQEIHTVTTPQEVTTLRTVEGKVWQVNGPHLILSFPSGENKAYTVPDGIVFHINGEDKTVFDLRKGMDISATVLTVAPLQSASMHTVVTGQAPPRPNVTFEGPMLIEPTSRTEDCPQEYCVTTAEDMTWRPSPQS